MKSNEVVFSDQFGDAVEVSAEGDVIFIATYRKGRPTRVPVMLIGDDRGRFLAAVEAVVIAAEKEG
jgi:hypothetical protein